MPETSPQQNFLASLPPPIAKPYLDSSVFIAHVKKELNVCPDGRPRWEIASRILKDGENGRYAIYTSTLAIAEVRRLKMSGQPLDTNEIKVVRELFEHEWIVPIEVNREIAESAQTLGAQYNLPVIDSVHLATAIWYECDVFLVWDKPLRNLLGVDVIAGVRICEPYWEGLAPMNASGTP